MVSPVGDLRLGLRTAGLAALTPTLLALYELERWRSGDRVAVLRRWTRRYGKLALALYGARAEVSLAEVGPDRTYPGVGRGGVGRVFVANHRSMLDIFACVRFLEGDFVARADMSAWPIIGFAANRIGTIWVDRKSRASGAAALEAMRDALAAGRSVLIFPEGTTFGGDEVRPFRSGAFRAAVAAGAEVVPVGLAYDGERLEYGDEGFFPHYRRVASLRRSRFAMLAGEPLARQAGEDFRGLRARAREAVQALVHQARSVLRA